jgi:hypothetical protein
LDEPDKPTQRTLAAMKWPKDTRLGLSRPQALMRGLEGSSAFDVIRFRSNGRTDNLVIELTNEQNQRRFIEVVGWTGEVRMREGSAQ